MRSITDVVDVSHYDLVLAVIPSVFALAMLADQVLAGPPEGAIAVASVICALVLVDALFLNPPTDGGE